MVVDRRTRFEKLDQMFHDAKESFEKLPPEQKYDLRPVDDHEKTKDIYEARILSAYHHRSDYRTMYEPVKLEDFRIVDWARVHGFSRTILKVPLSRRDGYYTVIFDREYMGWIIEFHFFTSEFRLDFDVFSTLEKIVKDF